MTAAAFAVIYLVWGTTFFAIKIGLESFPPFTLAALRFLSAGTIMLSIGLFARGEKLPHRGILRAAALSGFLMLSLGNGLVVSAEQWIASGAASLWIATVPIWMMALDWAFFGKKRPRTLALLGGAIGLAGVGILAASTEGGLAGHSPLPLAMLLAASFAWALGTHLQKRTGNGGSPWATAGVQLIAGGVALVIMAHANGEESFLQTATLTTRSWLAIAYLSLMGSVLAFSAYAWLVSRFEAHKAGTYALVNPVVALLVGNVLGGEPLSLALGMACLLVLAGVAMILGLFPRPK